MIELAGLAPEDHPAIVKAELELSHRPVMLVSHLPYLDRLAGLLIRGAADAVVVGFAPAMLACVTRNQASWKLNWYVDSTSQ